MEAWVWNYLACPRDHLPLQQAQGSLRCAAGHTYPCVDDIPILLVAEAPPTQPEFSAAHRAPPPEPIDACADGIDPFVQQAIASTGGLMYRPLQHRLQRYPIPELPLPGGQGRCFVELGCNWGRWCVSAARKGYRAIGLDPHLDAVRAARRVARQLGTPAQFVVADARYLPFRPHCLDVVFSYSVLQHFEKADVRRALADAARVVRPEGLCLIQMANAFGVRSAYHQLRRGGRPPLGFEVRYWTPRELLRTFEQFVGPTTLTADGYLSLNAQAADREMLRPHHRAIVSCSQLLRALSGAAPWLVWAADSVYVWSRPRRANVTA